MTNSLEVIPRFKYNYDSSNNIIWIGLNETPTKEDIDKIINNILKIKDSYIVHAEHISENSLIPSLDILYYVLSQLIEKKDVIKRQLKGTIIQTRAMDPIFEFVKNLALTIYKPTKPLCITYQIKEVEDFIRKINNT